MAKSQVLISKIYKKDIRFAMSYRIKRPALCAILCNTADQQQKIDSFFILELVNDYLISYIQPEEIQKQPDVIFIRGGIHDWSKKNRFILFFQQ